MEKKEYHGFDVEEEDFTGIEDINTASCGLHTFLGWFDSNIPHMFSYLYNQCDNYANEEITLEFQ